MTAVGQLVAAVWSIALLILALGAGAARADFEIAPGDISLKVLDAAGEPESRAGAHPDRFVATIVADNAVGAAENLKDLVIDFPAGLGGDPRAVPFCPRPQLEEMAVGGAPCPPDTQVGEVVTEDGSSTERTAIYSLDPGPNETVVFGMASDFGATKLVGALRPTDYGLSLALSDVSLPFEDSPPEKRFEFWGVPADHQVGTSISRRPFLTLPTHCGEPLAVTVRGRSWQRPDRWSSATADTGVPLSGCQGLAFAPRVGFGLGNPTVDSPTGMELGLTVPSNDDPDGQVASQVRRVSIALPEGIAFSPGASEGLRSCSDAELGLGTTSEATCPPSSRLGSAEMIAPQLGAPLQGGVYLGRELPGDRFRLLVAAHGGGTDAKFVGSLRSDPVSGGFTAILDNLPEVTFSRLVLRLDGGPRALLATPLSCGPAGVTATFTPYSGGPAAISSDAVTIAAPVGSRCGDSPFQPSFEGGTSTLGGGQPTALSMTVRRRDGEQLPDRIDVAFPPGVSALLSSVGLCPAAGAATGSCPAASRVGAASGEVGSGPSPAELKGDVYLGGPYRRAPFSLVIAFHAVLGPFDLGTVAVRAGLRLDPLTGQVTVSTDSLPREVEGIPIRFRTIGLDIDRPGFMRNPTSCRPASVNATVRSAAGATFRAASSFDLRGCVGLRFQPDFSMALTDPKQLHGGGRPGLRISARIPPRSANLRAVETTLPEVLKLDSGGLREICSRRDARDGSCPPGSRVGSGSARTPLLSKPMRGSVYVVQPRGSGSPDLWTSLEGEGVRVELRSETRVEDGAAETKLLGLPDVPLSTFTLRFDGGEHGVLSLRHGLCGATGVDRLVAPMTVEGQSGAVRKTRTRIAARPLCGDRSAGGAGAAHRRGGRSG